ncbi:MAG TPA: hypothetical protein VK988_02000, partial [Acidimicrobiales bacterium]|nr:hypothetical protein [Acidimicrobiales bacterium]
VAAATTFTSARGPAAPVLLFYEFAFVQGAGTTATSTDIYRAATPAVMQFHDDALIIQTSSPWEQTGQLYDSYLRGLAVDPTTGKAKDPATLVLQLPSWELYEHDEPAESIPMWPGGPTFVHQPPKITRAQVADLEAQGVEVAVEYLAHFATTRHAYLRPDKVNAIFGPWRGRTLSQQHTGRMDYSYVAHADPSRSNANFAFAIGHREVDDQGRTHVVFDLLHVWRPEEFPDRVIDYPTVENEIFRYIEAFRLTVVTFDQYNSLQSIQQLNVRATTAELQWRPHIHERTATAPHNFKASETFKTAVNAGLVHAPHHDLAQQELLYLVEEGATVTHPSTGPVRTDDLADAMINVTYTLLHGRGEEVHQQFAATPLSASWHRDRNRGTPQEQFAEFYAGGRRRREAPPHNPARGRRPPGRFGRP